ncbi:unnamed protein product [marine sediment metagenome]|uniref:Uncharacterized protein n=1 Tax=marine sediment metagenome TaxID=412755 RepID=X1EJL8_9ZZZZ
MSLFLSWSWKDVIAGVVCILTMIVMNLDDILFSRVCKKVGIKPSTIYYQIK